MKKLILAMILGLSTSIHCNEVPPKKMEEKALYAGRNSTALSMMGWGISLVVGIAALVCLIPNHTASSDS